MRIQQSLIVYWISSQQMLDNTSWFLMRTRKKTNLSKTNKKLCEKHKSFLCLKHSKHQRPFRVHEKSFGPVESTKPVSIQEMPVRKKKQQTLSSFFSLFLFFHSSSALNIMLGISGCKKVSLRLQTFLYTLHGQHTIDSPWEKKEREKKKEHQTVTQ